MSGGKHTPGPWVYSFESVDPEWAVVTTVGGSVIANVNSDHRQEANARLIAAAPETAAERDRLKEVNADLLAALKQFRTKVYNAALISGMDHEWATEACSRADAAIAKAEGGAA